MKKMFSNEIPKKCEYCINASPIGRDKEMVCLKRGIVNADDLCRKYKYDPLKREPKKQLISDNYSPEDFKL